MILLSLSSLVTSLCIIFVYTTLISEQIQNDLLNDLDVIATNEKRRINDSIDHSYEFLAINTARPNMILRLAQYNEHEDPIDQENMHTVLDSIKKSSSQIRRVSLLNPEGINVASSDRSYIGHDLSNENFVSTVRNGSNYYDLSKFEDNTLGIRLAAPLYWDDNFVGIFTIVLEPSEITDFNYSGVGESGDIYLIKKDTADTIVFLTPSRFDDDAAFNKKITVGENPATKAVSGIEGTFSDLVDYRNTNVLSATKYIEKTNWGLVVKTNVVEALIPIDEVRNFTMSLGVGLTATLLLVAYYFSKIISNPISQLQESAKQISLGHDVKIDIKSNDEVGELAKSLDHMLNELKHMAKLHLETEKLRQIDKEKDEFSAMITHELKTPLVPILGYCKMLKKQMIGIMTKDQIEAINAIEKSAKRLESLMEDIMDARKVDMGKLRFKIEDVLVDDLFEDLVSSYTSVLKQQDREFIINLQVRGVIIQSDKSRLRQVFDNLISNAIKFTPAKKGIIEVGCKKENNVIIFYVKDNGIGIPQDKQSGLFKKFYQIDTSLRRPVGGTGLGLAISKGIVEGLNGKIWIESDGSNGTAFYFEFNL